MAQTLIWSQVSLDDIDDIAEYISRDSEYHAQQVVERIFETGTTIVQHPKIGRVVPELNNPLIRERFIYSYRLIYEISDQEIRVLAVIHGSRLLESI
jgi:toxin ParE1/3/4